MTSVSDFHCVTSWSRLDNRWEGVTFRTIAELVRPKPQVKYVIGEDDLGYTANLPLVALMDEDVLLAYKHDGRDLEVIHGGPLRLVVPKRYGGSRSNGSAPYIFVSTTNRDSGKCVAIVIPQTHGQTTVIALETCRKFLCIQQRRPQPPRTKAAETR